MSPCQGRSSSSNWGYSETSGRFGTTLEDRIGLILDALIGYGLDEEPQGVMAEMISAVK
ncbi:MAG: hypothetical protein ACRDZM_16420 [Acidimicrobiia bacterium]